MSNKYRLSSGGQINTSQAQTDSNGYITGYWKDNGDVGTFKITAQLLNDLGQEVGFSTAIINLESADTLIGSVVAGVDQEFSPNNILGVLDIGEYATYVEAIVYRNTEDFGNPPLPNVLVEFELLDAENAPGYLYPTEALTNENGVARVPYVIFNEAVEDMTVNFKGSNLELNLGSGDVAEYVVNDDNTARIIMASTSNISKVLDVIDGEITSIEKIDLVSTDSGNYAILDNVQIETPSVFAVKSAYPNPFNPSTNLSLELNATANVSVKVFNIMGQLVDVIAEGSFSPNTYNWTWNAENLSSGVYLVRTQVGSKVDTQKLMLLK